MGAGGAGRVRGEAKMTEFQNQIEVLRKKNEMRTAWTADNPVDMTPVLRVQNEILMVIAEELHTLAFHVKRWEEAKRGF